MTTRSDVRPASAPGVLASSLPPRRHVLDLDDYSIEEIELVMQTTDAMGEVLRRSIRKVPTLQGKTVVTLFYEPSTRTRVSFEQAGKVLSADVINLSIASSSVEKGESLLNTARTLEATQADVIIIRHGASGAANFLARCIEGSVINAGDGAHAHPTQALLDLYTLRQRLGSIEGAKITIVGDVLHSRVARSNLWGLAAAGAKVVLCGPPTLLPMDWLRDQHLQGRLASVSVTTSINDALDGADAVMTLRLQKERQQDGLIPSLREYARSYQINADRLKLAKTGAPVMHPGPMNEGVEISSDVAHGASSVIEAQVANGVAVRMAVLYLLATGRGEE
jgi:aspartate carbamoyltransferase catalytic subunit